MDSTEFSQQEYLAKHVKCHQPGKPMHALVFKDLIEDQSQRMQHLFD